LDEDTVVALLVARESSLHTRIADSAVNEIRIRIYERKRAVGPNEKSVGVGVLWPSAVRVPAPTENHDNRVVTMRQK